MMSNIIKAAFFILLNYIVCAQSDETENYIDEVSISGEKPFKINKETFLETIGEPEFGTLIMFYAPWCGHCKRMVNIWNQLSKKHNKHKKFYIAKIDCTDQIELCSDKDILAYPTFLFFKKNVPNGISYDGERSLESIESFMLNQVENNVQETTIQVPVHELDENNFESFISKGFHFIKFFAPWCGHCKMLAPTWEELGQRYLNSKVKISKIDCTKYGIICSSNNIRGYPTLMLFYNGKLVELYERKRTIEDFVSFLQENILKHEQESEKDEYVDLRGKVISLSENNFKNLIQSNGLVFVKFFAPWCGHCKAMVQEWENLAVKLKDNQNILIAEVDCTQQNQICSEQNIQGYPTLTLFRNGFKVSEYGGHRNVDSFMEYLNPFLQHEEL